MRRKKANHFSHRHPLHETTVQEDDQTTCSACELDLSGPAYKCNETMCNYYMHKACFELPLKTSHKSHPAHPLTLLSSPAFDAHSFTCNACGENGSAFAYHCETCDYYLHVNCVSLVETVTREDHQHPISLCYSVVYDEEDTEIVCDVCDGSVPDGCWVYCCKECDFGTHLGCATTKKEKASSEEAEDEEEEEEADSESEEEEAESESESESEEDGGESRTSDPVRSRHQANMRRLKNASRSTTELVNEAYKQRMQNAARSAALSLWD